MTENRPDFFKSCPICNTDTPPGIVKCPNCGVDLEIARANLIKTMATEAGKYGLVADQHAERTDPPKSKLTFGSILGYILLCFFLLVIYGVIKDTIIFPMLYAAPTLVPTAIPRPQFTPTIRVVSSGESSSCTHWSKITSQLEGRELCVYGIVSDHKENWDNELTNFYFGTKEQFFLVSNYRWSTSFTGQCVTVDGVVQLNTYKVPYIKIEDVINPCEPWMEGN